MKAALPEAGPPAALLRKRSRRLYFAGGLSGLLAHLAASSDFSGSSPSQSRHCQTRGPLPPGGKASVIGLLHLGQRLCWELVIPASPHWRI
jgi:hypothetical protein